MKEEKKEKLQITFSTMESNWMISKKKEKKPNSLSKFQLQQINTMVFFYSTRNKQRETIYLYKK